MEHSRRNFLLGSAALLGGALAGCSNPPSQPVKEDPQIARDRESKASPSGTYPQVVVPTLVDFPDARFSPERHALIDRSWGVTCRTLYDNTTQRLRTQHLEAYTLDITREEFRRAATAGRDHYSANVLAQLKDHFSADPSYVKRAIYLNESQDACNGDECTAGTTEIGGNVAYILASEQFVNPTDTILPGVARSLPDTALHEVAHMLFADHTKETGRLMSASSTAVRAAAASTSTGPSSFRRMGATTRRSNPGWRHPRA